MGRKPLRRDPFREVAWILVTIVFVVALVTAFTLWAVQWYSAPCEDFAEKWYLRNGNAPARCVDHVR